MSKKRKSPTVQKNMSKKRKKLPNLFISPSLNQIEEFSRRVKQLQNLFRKYSVFDIATSVLTSGLWLPNISSPINHLLLSGVMLSLTRDDYQNRNTIASYSDFTQLISSCYELLPLLSSIEDYIPESDWGEIKYFFNGSLYKIFYGNDLPHIVDHLAAFELIYVTFDREFRSKTGRSPKLDLTNTLALQDELLSKVAQASSSLCDIRPGHVEVPTEDFWRNVIRYVQTFGSGTVDQKFIESVSIEIGKNTNKKIELKTFIENSLTGRSYNHFFIQYDGKFIPMLPRRWSCVLREIWAEIWNNSGHEIKDGGMPYSFGIGRGLYRYIECRIRTSNIFPIVNAFDRINRKHHPLFFDVALFIDGTLYLLHVLEPLTDSNRAQKLLADLEPELRESLALVQAPTIAINLNVERKILEFCPREGSTKGRVRSIVVLPNLVTNLMFRINKDFPAEIIFLDELLGVIDEIFEPSTFDKFFDYVTLTGSKVQANATALDKFSSFVDSFGTLEAGATQYDRIYIYEHGGSTHRFKVLKEFWSLHPNLVVLDNPRHWRVEKEDTGVTRIISRNRIGCMLHTKVGAVDILSTIPYEKLSYAEVKFADMLPYSLIDAFANCRKICEEYEIFRKAMEVRVFLYPDSLIRIDEDFSFVRHLLPNKERWLTDYGEVDQGIFGIRVVYNNEKVLADFSSATDATLQIDLLLEVLEKINERFKDTKWNQLRSEIDKTKNRKPRFKVFMRVKEVAFPELSRVIKPTQGDFKLARKQIAMIAKAIGINAGNYDLANAKIILNRLRDQVVVEIEARIAKLSFGLVLPHLIDQIEALNHENFMQRMRIENAKDYETSYSVPEESARGHEAYTTMHKNYRYLLEKVVFINPTGSQQLTITSLAELLALIDWLHVIYNASDSIQYEIEPAGIEFSDEFLIHVKFPPELDQKRTLFGLEEQKLMLGTKGNLDDAVGTVQKSSEFIKDLNKAYIRDLGFSLECMVTVLTILSQWPHHHDGGKEEAHYRATQEKIVTVALNTAASLKKEEVELAIDFLTLDRNGLVRINEQPEPCKDIPVWEHTKRPVRYNLRPLIPVDNELVWGPYSSMNTCFIWTGAASEGFLPTDLGAPTIEKTIGRQKKRIEVLLVEKACEITKRFTPLVETNVELHKRDRGGNHPQNLGDYDVLAFLPEAKLLLNIECKDLIPYFCMKDAKRLRTRIFGDSKSDLGYLGKIENRETYLRENTEKVFKALRWDFPNNELLRIESIYLARRNYWWTANPPRATRVHFLVTEMLSEFIRSTSVSIK